MGFLPIRYFKKKEKRTIDMKIKFDLSDQTRFGELKVRHMRLMTSGKADLDTMMSVMSRFMVEEDGKYLEPQAAFDVLDDLAVNQLNDVATLFLEAVSSTNPKEN